MILREVIVRNWGIFREDFIVEFADGINVLVGLNETGKTTVVDAIRTAFFEKHTSSSSKIFSLMPWGSTLSPSISVVFENGGDQYRITKTFISPQASHLEKVVAGRWTRIAEGDRADIQAAELAGGEVSSRRASRPQDWGLGQVLWAKQGDTLPDTLNKETLDKLQASVGSVITSGDERKVFQRLSEEFDAVLTPKTHQCKANSLLYNTLTEIKELEAKAQELDESWTKQEQLERAIEDLQIQLIEKGEELKLASDELAEASAEAKAATVHQQQRIRLEGEVDLFREQWEALRSTVETIRQLGKAIEERKATIRTCHSDLKALIKERNTIEKKLKAAREKLDEIDESIQKNQEDLTYVRIAHDTIEKERRELSALEQNFLKAQNSITRIADLRSELSTSPAPTDEELNSLRETLSALNEKEAELKAIGLSLTVRAEHEMSGAIYLDGKKRGVRIPARGQQKWEAAQRVKMKIERVGELEIRSGSRDVQKLRDEVEALQEEYKRRTAPYLTAELSVLDALAKKRRNLETELKTLEQKVDELAPEGTDRLKKQVAELRESIKSSWGKIPDDSPHKRYEGVEDRDLARDETGRAMEMLEKESQNVQKQKRQKVKEQREIESSLGETNEGIRHIELAMKHAEGELARSSEQLKELKRDGLSTEKREARFTTLGLELERKTAALQIYREEQEQKEEKPFRRLERAETRLPEFRESIRSLEANLSREEGRLDQLLQQGIYTRRNQVEEQLESLLKKKNNLETDVCALDVLYDLIQFFQNQTLESVMEPIKNRVVEDLRRVAGPRYSDVELDTGMRPSAVRPAGLGEKSDIDILSYGTQEQLGLLVRLALGHILAQDERQLVILDDPLTNTDDIRMTHCLQILQEAAKRIQIILLTCHPDRYSSIEERNLISMQQPLPR